MAFTGEKQATENYETKLETAYKTTVETGLFSGLGIGILMFVVFCTHGLAIWYGARLIMNEGYSGGQVMNVIFAIVNGGM